MSKVYSFRLSDDNPREAQDREVIKAWVEGGYSLRYVITEAIINYANDKNKRNELALAIDQLKNLIEKMDDGNIQTYIAKETFPSLSNTFITAVKKSAKMGIASNQ